MKELLYFFEGTTVSKTFKAGEQMPVDIYKAKKAFHSKTKCWVQVKINRNGKEHITICASNNEVQENSTVYGIFCRRFFGIPVGILISKELYVLGTTHGQALMDLLEYSAFQYNQNTYKTSECIRQNQKTIHLRNTKNQDFWKILRNIKKRKYKNMFLFARVDQSMQKIIDGRETCAAILRIDEAEFLKNDPDLNTSLSFRYNLEYFTSADEIVAVLLYVIPDESTDNGYLSAYVFTSYFTKFIQSLNNEDYQVLVSLLTSPFLSHLGKILLNTKVSIDPTGEMTIARAMVIGSMEHLATGTRIQIRFLNQSTDDPAKNYIYNVGDMTVGQVVCVQIRSKIRLYKDDNTDEDIDDSEDVDLKIPEEDSHTDDDLFMVRKNEFRLIQDGKNQSIFYVNKFNSDIHQNRIGSLHYDVLEWIGKFQYCTKQFIFRLFLCGLIPHRTTLLKESELETARKIVSNRFEREKTANEGGDERKVHYTVCNEDYLPSIINRLQSNGLIESTYFDGKCPARVLILTYQGQRVLEALGRSSIYADSFAYLKTPYEVKENLSGTQLCVAYLENLNQHYRVDLSELKHRAMLGHPMYQNIEKMARVIFTMYVRDKQNNDRKVRLAGISVRNPIGRLTQSMEELSLDEKIMRIMEVMNETAKNEDHATIFTIVFTTYAEMVGKFDKVISYFRDNHISPDPKLKVCITYDRLILGSLEDSHFEVDFNKGEFKRIHDFTGTVNDALSISKPTDM